MYRITFDTKAGVWRIQIQSNLIFWTSICDNGKVRGWPNVKACEEFIKETGIDKVYRNANGSMFRQIAQGGYPHPPQKPATWQVNMPPAEV